MKYLVLSIFLFSSQVALSSAEAIFAEINLRYRNGDHRNRGNSTLELPYGKPTKVFHTTSQNEDEEPSSQTLEVTAESLSEKHVRMQFKFTDIREGEVIFQISPELIIERGKSSQIEFREPPVAIHLRVKAHNQRKDLSGEPSNSDN